MEQNVNPLVSVIIPCYNQEKYIENTLKSVLDQTYSNFEIIIVDDGSTDSTVQISANIASIDKRIKIYRNEHVGRPSIPRNFGISKANGDLIAFLDSDDIWTKNKLMDQVKYLLKNPSLVFVYSMSVTFGEVNALAPEYEVLPLLFNAARSYEDLCRKGNSITCSSVLVKADLLKKANGFDEDPLLQIEDYDLWLRLSKEGILGFIPRIHVYYRIHKVQYSSSWEVKKQRLDYLMKKRAISLPEYKFIRNRNIFLKLLRNGIHILTFCWVKILEKFETGIMKHPLYRLF